MKPIKILLALMIFYTISLNAQDVINITKGQKQMIGKNILFFVDTTNKLGIHELNHQLFQPYNTEIVNFGNIPHCVWMKFAVQSPSEKEVYLELVAPLLSNLEIYEKVDTGYKSLFVGGFTKPFKERKIALENWIVNLKIDSIKPTSFMIKGQSLFPFQVPISVSAKDKFLEESQLHNLFWGTYMGIMIFAFIYNIFLYFSLRERTYLYYVLYIALSSSFYLGLEGYNYQYLWPNMPILNQYIPVLICATNIIIVLFTLRFLQISKKEKIQYYFGIGFMLAFALIALINFLGRYEIAIGLAQLFSLFIALFLITCGFLSLKRGIPTAKYYLIAWLTFLALVIVFLLAINNVIVSNFFTTHCIFIGHVSEVLLLSFALADRINWLKKENELKQKEIIVYLREKEEVQLKANAELEIKVIERTAELVENQQKLIESEKMATIGVLASRMAHEIQNPLNFVNNFSELTIELVDEVEAIIPKEKENMETVDLLKDNLQKINHYGKLASNIITVLNNHLRAGTASDFFLDSKNK